MDGGSQRHNSYPDYHPDERPGFIPTPLLFQVAGVATLLAALPLLKVKTIQRDLVE